MLQKHLLIFLVLCFVSSCANQSQRTIVKPVEIAQKSSFNASDLCAVASETKNYLVSHPEDRYAVHDGKGLKESASVLSVKRSRVEETLRFVCTIAREDAGSNVKSRLHDPVFLEAHFDFYLWQPDKSSANNIAEKSTNAVKAKKLQDIPENKILLTKYYVKKLKGSPIKTPLYTQALYALPYDEKGLTAEQADAKRASLTRFKFTRQDIIHGAIEKDALAEPLIWLTEDSLHDVLLQGTGVIDDGRELRYFNVHRNNGIAYDYAIGMKEQARYWYFSEVSSVLGYGKKLSSKIPLKKHVSVAGNIEQIGLGRLFLIQYPVDGSKTKHLAVLADEGGAFKDNLFQLDLLVGAYEGWSDYYRDYNAVPDYASVWLMLKK